jgi:hypothetical protein
MISGTGFTNTTKVYFGTYEAFVNNIYDHTGLRVKVPAVSEAGLVDVKVMNEDGSEAVLPGSFTYIAPIPVPAPVLDSISPDNGPLAGGTIVYLYGQNLNNKLKVYFGNKMAPILTCYDSTKMNVVSPAGSAEGPVDVKVVDADGRESVLTGAFTYIAPPPPPGPTLTSVSPDNGSLVGGNVVSLTGSNFKSNTQIYFGTKPAILLSVFDGIKMNVVVPAGVSAGTVDVKVVNADGQEAVLTSAYTYIVPQPTVTGLSPNTGLITGGTIVTVNGTNFSSQVKVLMAGKEITPLSYLGSTRFTFATPAVMSAGPVDVTILNKDTGASVVIPNGFTYTEPIYPTPTITSISPNSGVMDGGTVVTVYGKDFSPSVKIIMNGTEISPLSYYNSTSFAFVTPKVTTAGAVDITVLNKDTGKSSTLASAFTYTAPPPKPAPAIASISVNSGTAAGGTMVTVTGANMQTGCKVVVDGVEYSYFVYYNTGSLLFLTPAHAVGTVTIKIKNPDGQLSNSVSFEYK